jgi:Protein of unknown function (DUF4242)
MRRYRVQPRFPDRLRIPAGHGGTEVRRAVIEQNGEQDMTWITSFVSDDKSWTFYVCDAPTPEAIGTTVAGNALPADQITRVSVLDRYFYS